MRLAPLVLATVAACNLPAFPTRQTPLFDFRVSPWLNLHQRLLAEVRANAPSGGPPWHEAVPPCSCSEGQDGKPAPAWSAALAAYATLGNRELSSDQPLAEMNLALGLARPDGSPQTSRWIPELVPPLLAAYPLYVDRAWTDDKKHDDAWIADVGPLVAKWGPGLAAQIAEDFETVWPTEPVLVEVSRYAGWAGAYTTDNPILTTVSSEDAGYRGEGGLEMLFHEASHGLVGTLQHDLDMAFLERGKDVPHGLYHVLIFYTAGERVRERLGTGYVPYGYKNKVYQRGWEKLEPVVRIEWQRWLDREATLPVTLSRLADLL